MDSEQDDIALVEAVRNGDRSAELKLLLKYNKALWKLVLRTKSSVETREDLYQEAVIAFLRVIRESFDPSLGNKLITFLYVQVSYRLQDASRHTGVIRMPREPKAWKRATKMVKLSMIDDAHWLRSSCNTFAEVCERDLLRAIKAELDGFGGKRREIVLSRVNGETQQEIADRIGISKQRVQQLERDTCDSIRAFLQLASGEDSEVPVIKTSRSA